MREKLRMDITFLLPMFIAFAGIAILLWYLWGFTIDDAYISFRYSHHLAEGNGLVWNTGEAPVEGYTNFLWVVLLAAAELLGFDVVLAAKLLGVISLFFVLLFLRSIASFVFAGHRKQSLVAFCSCTLLLFLNPATGVHTVSGLETMLYAACVLGIVYFSLRLLISKTSEGAVGFSVVCLISYLTRPETALIVASLAIFLYFAAVRKRAPIDNRIRILLTFSVVFLAPAIVYTIFRMMYFGDLFPLTFYVKSWARDSAVPGLVDTVRAFVYLVPMLILVMVVVARRLDLMLQSPDSKYTRFRWLVITVFLTAVSANIIYPFSALLMNYDYRYFFPSFVCIYSLVGTSVALILEDIPRISAASSRFIHRTFYRITVLILAVLVVSVNIVFVPSAMSERDYGENLPRSHIALGKALAEFADLNLTLAIGDAGAIPYYSNWRTIDIWGLNDKFISKNGGATIQYIEENHPSLVILLSSDVKEPAHVWRQEPFIEFVENNSYSQLPSIRFSADYYLLPYLDTGTPQFDDIRVAIEDVSRSSFVD